MRRNRSVLCSEVDREDKTISEGAVMYFLAQCTNITIKTVFSVSEKAWGLISVIFGAIIVLFFLRGLKYVFKRSNNLIIKSYGFFILVFVISFVLISSRNEPTSVLTGEYLLNVFVFWLPTGIFVASVKNKEILYDTFIKASYIFFVLAIMCFFWGKVKNEDEQAYNMSLGFAIIIPTLFHLNEAFKGNIKLLILFIIEMIILLIYANRGILLSVAFFVIYKVLTNQKRGFFSIIIILAALYVVFYSKEIAIGLLNILDDFNLYSRTLMKFAEASIFETSGRDEIWDICNNIMWDHPILGWGLGGECYPIYMRMDTFKEFGYGFSPHNGLLQLLLQFGVIFGSIAVILFLYPIFNMHKIQDLKRRDLVLIFCSSIAIPCCYSTGDIFLKPVVAVYLYCFYFDISRHIKI